MHSPKHVLRRLWPPLPARYGVAVAATLVATWVRGFLPSLLSEHAPDLLFLPVVALVSWLGGLGPGVLATILSAIAGIVRWETPFNFATHSLNEWVEWLLFVPMGLVVAALAGSLHKAREAAERAADDLQILNDRFELAGQAMEGYVYEADLKTQTVWRSDGFLRFLGFGDDETPNTLAWWKDQCQPDDFAAITRAYEAASARGDDYDLEYRVRHKDGSWRWVWDRGLVLRAPDGTPLKNVGSVVDITGRNLLEEALRAGEEKFRQLADSMPQIVWAARPDGTIDYYNRRWYDFTGFDPPFSGDISWQPILHPDEVQECADTWCDAVKSGQIYQIEYRFKDRKTGSYKWFLGRGLPVRNENGDIVRWFGTCTDIDEQKRAEEKQRFLAGAGVILAASLDFEGTLQRLATLAVPELADWCFVVLEDEGGVLRLHGAAHQDADKVAAAWDAYHRWGFTSGVKFGPAHIVATGKSQFLPEIPAGAFVGTSPDAEHRQFLKSLGQKSIIGVPVQVGGKTFGAIMLAYAESNRRYALSDLALAEELGRRAGLAIENARLYRDLQDADQRKDEFLAMLAHELRNPLAAISGASQVLEAVLDENARRDSQGPRAILVRQTQHLARLVDDLLDVSRITQGKIELRCQSLDFRGAIQTAVDAAQSLVQSRRHTLKLQFPDFPVFLNADAARMQQIVSNLVTNAAKYTDLGGKIEVSLETEGEEAVLRVRDNGTGLTSEMQEGVWELFVQVERTLDRAQGGLGIGLTLVRLLTEMHGGHVSAHSDGPGQGSEFCVRLPLSSKTENGSRKSEPKDIVTSASQILSSRKILVVDDNHDAAIVLTMLLKSRGFQAKVATDGRGALNAAQEWKPDVVLLDIGMPEMDGYEVARRLRADELGSRLQLVALTGYGQDGDRLRAHEAGFDHHLTKPVEWETLRDVLEK